MEGFAKRKASRLPGYDYSQGGVYFLTICAAEHEPLFGRVEFPETCVGGGVPDALHVRLSRAGTEIQFRITEMIRRYEGISLCHYVIMPNHVHLLLQLENGPSGTPAPTHEQRANQIVPAFVSTLKRMTNKRCGQNLWQRGYHDHVVRNDADYLRIWQYIETNPAKWAEDKYYTR